MNSYRDLHAWQLARALVKRIYIVTSDFPREERYGITSQMRSAAISIMSNIAEGYGRRTRGEYLQFLSNANGSQHELESLIIASEDLGFHGDAKLLEECEHCGRVLRRLYDSLRPSPAP